MLSRDSVDTSTTMTLCIPPLTLFSGVFFVVPEKGIMFNFDRFTLYPGNRDHEKYVRHIPLHGEDDCVSCSFLHKYNVNIYSCIYLSVRDGDTAGGAAWSICPYTYYVCVVFHIKLHAAFLPSFINTPSVRPDSLSWRDTDSVVTDRGRPEEKTQIQVSSK